MKYARLWKWFFKDIWISPYLACRMRFTFAPSRKPYRERWEFALKWIKKHHRDIGVKLQVFGRENIPVSEKGIFYYGNHQGKDDAYIVAEALGDHPSSFAIDKRQSYAFFMKDVCAMAEAALIDFTSLRSQAKTYEEMAQAAERGVSYFVFPEAGYEDNKNTLQTFHSPCFKPAMQAQAVIVPFVLYDAWRVFKDGDAKEVEVQCHFLPPVYPCDYAAMNRRDLAEHVKSLIQAKLNEIENNES